MHNSMTKLDRAVSVNSKDDILYYVNKGFPIDNSTWDRMWNYVVKLNPEARKSIENARGNENLPEKPVPALPLLKGQLSVQEQLDSVQNYMTSLEYNHTGTQFFDIRKNRPICGLVEVAKEIITESLPIKCLEAVILGLYLTIPLETVERFPLSFHSHFLRRTYRHVVLGVYHAGRYGALGMSRRQDLMYKELKYKSLSELVMDFVDSYKKYCHEVRKVKIGLCVTHDAHSFEQVSWKNCSLSVLDLTKEELCRRVDKHARVLRSQTSGHLPDVASPLPPPQKSESKAAGKSSPDDKGKQIDTAKRHHVKVHPDTNYQLRI